MRKSYKRFPTDDEINNIPVAALAEFELSERECAKLRRHLYAVNRDGIRRYRTLREHKYLLVWRIK